MDELKALAEAIVKNTKKNKTNAYETLATVLRLDGENVYVHIDGGAPETPATATMACKEGDTVRIHVEGGKAWVIGNVSAPATDDTAANTAHKAADTAQATAEDSAKTATNFVTEKGTGGQILVHPEGDTKNAVLIGQDVQIIRNGVTVATYSDAVKIGNASSGHTEISPNEQKFIADDGTIVMDTLRDTSRVYAITETAYTDDTEGQSGSYVNKAKLSYPMYRLEGIYARDNRDITADVTYTYNSTTYTLENMTNADSDGDPMDMKHYIYVKYIPDIDNVTMSVGRYPRVDNRGKLLVLGNGLSNADRRNVLTVDMLGNLWSAAGIEAQTAKFTKHVNLPQKYLWTGALYMSGNHTAELSEKISEQNSGIVLMWSSYDGGVKDENWSFFFVPKIVIGSSHIENKGMLCSAAHPWTRPGKTQDMTFMRKYVYIHNDSITGNDININNSYAANKSYVLRGVVGV